MENPDAPAPTPDRLPEGTDRRWDPCCSTGTEREEGQGAYGPGDALFDKQSELLLAPEYGSTERHPGDDTDYIDGCCSAVTMNPIVEGWDQQYELDIIQQHELHQKQLLERHDEAQQARVRKREAEREDGRTSSDEDGEQEEPPRPVDPWEHERTGWCHRVQAGGAKPRPPPTPTSSGSSEETVAVLVAEDSSEWPVTDSSSSALLEELLAAADCSEEPRVPVAAPAPVVAAAASLLSGKPGWLEGPTRKDMTFDQSVAEFLMLQGRASRELLAATGLPLLPVATNMGVAEAATETAVASEARAIRLRRLQKEEAAKGSGPGDHQNDEKKLFDHPRSSDHTTLAIQSIHSIGVRFEVGPGGFSAGDVVTVDGLTGEKAAAHNGKVGSILCWNNRKQRYNLRMMDGPKIAVKCEKLARGPVPKDGPPSTEQAPAFLRAAKAPQAPQAGGVVAGSVSQVADLVAHLFGISPCPTDLMKLLHFSALDPAFDEHAEDIESGVSGCLRTALDDARAWSTDGCDVPEVLSLKERFNALRHPRDGWHPRHRSAEFDSESTRHNLWRPPVMHAEDGKVLGGMESASVVVKKIDEADFDWLMRRGGVPGCSKEVYNHSRQLLQNLVETLVKDALKSTSLRHDRVCQVSDVLRAMAVGSAYTIKEEGDDSKRVRKEKTNPMGEGVGGTGPIFMKRKVVYGFGPGIWSLPVYRVLKQVHPDLQFSARGLAVCNDIVSDFVGELMVVLLGLPEENIELSADGGVRTHRLVRRPVLASPPMGNFLAKPEPLPSPAGEADGSGETGIVAVLAQRIPDAERDAAEAEGSIDATAAAMLHMLRVVDVESVEKATRLRMPGELSKHGVAEGSKAIATWQAAQRVGKPPGSRRGALNEESEWTKVVHGERAYYGRGGDWGAATNTSWYVNQPEELSLELPAEGVKEVRVSDAQDFERQYEKAGGGELATVPEPELEPELEPEPEPDAAQPAKKPFPPLEGSNLVFRVEMVAAAAAIKSRGIVLTETAAVFLAGVVEYITAEILELAGNAAKDLKSSYVQPRHIMLALQGDEELDMLFRHGIIRDGGVIPHIHKSILELPLNEKGSAARQFDDVFASMLDAAPDKILVDPRDGNHYLLNANYDRQLQEHHEQQLEKERQRALDAQQRRRYAVRRDHDKLTTSRFVPLPEFDALSTSSVESRQRAAVAELPDASRVAMDADARNTVAVAKRRLQEIRQAQRGGELLINRAIFAQLVAEIGRGVSEISPFFTREAIDAVQVVAEQHMLLIYQGSVLAMLACSRERSAGQRGPFIGARGSGTGWGPRAAIFPIDMQLATRISMASSSL